MDHRPCALYRLYDAGGVLLYIGRSINPERRWTDHRKEMPWWPEVVRKETEWLPEGTDPCDAEFDAISTENPLYNKTGFGSGFDGVGLGPVLPDGVPPQPLGTYSAYRCRELRPMYRQAWFLWRLLLQDGLETEKERAAQVASTVSAAPYRGSK